MFSLSILQSALELGCIYSLVALALFLSFRVLNIADMTTDGAFTLGCAVSATAAVAGHPILGLFLAMAAGAAAGAVTALLQTRLGVPSILAGIVTNTGLYTVNLAVMGFSSNVPMLKTTTVFTLLQDVLGKDSPYKLVIAAVAAAAACAALVWFLGTRLGLSIRATGDNPDMVRASSINTAFTILVGLCVSNCLTALSGAVLAQVPALGRYQPRHRHGRHRSCFAHHRRNDLCPRRHLGQGAGRCRRQYPLPLHHCAGAAGQRSFGMSQTAVRRHCRAGHRHARHPRKGGFCPPPRRRQTGRGPLKCWN